MDLQDLIQYGEDTVQEYIRELPDLRIGMNSPDKKFRYTDYTKWRSRVVSHLKELDNNNAIKVQDLFEKFEAEFSQSAFSEVIAQLYVALDKFNKTLKSQTEEKPSKSSVKTQKIKKKKTVSSKKSAPLVKKETLDKEVESKKENNKQSSQSDNGRNVLIFYKYKHHGHTIEKIITHCWYKLAIKEFCIDSFYGEGYDFNKLIEYIKSMNSAFAIFIYQATDKGCGNKFRAQLVLRANQGLIFQHGILYELLGNERVCALVEEGVEYPETMSRIAHIKIDGEDKWIQILIKRMRNAGLDIPLLSN